MKVNIKLEIEDIVWIQAMLQAEIEKNEVALDDIQYNYTQKILTEDTKRMSEVLDSIDRAMDGEQVYRILESRPTYELVNFCSAFVH